MRRVVFIVYFLITLPAFSQNNSLLWEVSGKDLKEPSFIYGTIHLRDAKIFQFGEVVHSSFDRCKAVAGELVMDSVINNPVAAMKMMMMPADTTLDILLDSSDYQFVKNVAVEKLGPMSLVVDRIKPFFTMALFTELDTEKDSTASLDQYFQQRGAEKGMEVLGIETVKEQIDAIDRMSLKDQAAMMLASLKEDDKSDNMTEQMMTYYLTQNIDSLESLFHDKEMSQVMLQSVLLDRNHIMSERIEKMIRQQSTFVAIGAGHLAGKEGVLNLLTQKGYTVKPVHFDFTKAKDNTVANTVAKEKKDAFGWYIYDSPDSLYQVHFPAKFHSENIDGNPSILTEKSGAIYSATEEQLMKESASKFLNRRLKEFKKDGIKVIDSKKGKNGDLPFAYIEVEEAGISIIFQFYYINPNLAVELAVTGNKEVVDAKMTKDFLRSIKKR